MENFTSTFEQTIELNDKKIIISNKKVTLLQMMANDINRKVIAHHLNITNKTIDFHLSYMKKQLGCGSVYALLALMFRKGILK